MTAVEDHKDVRLGLRKNLLDNGPIDAAVLFLSLVVRVFPSAISMSSEALVVISAHPDNFILFSFAASDQPCPA